LIIFYNYGYTKLSIKVVGEFNMSEIVKEENEVPVQEHSRLGSLFNRARNESRKYVAGATMGVVAVVSVLGLERSLNTDAASADTVAGLEAEPYPHLFLGEDPTVTPTPTPVYGEPTEPTPTPTPTPTPIPRAGTGANPATDSLRWFYDGTLPQGHKVRRGQKLSTRFDINQAGLKVTATLKGNKGLPLSHKGSTPDWHLDSTTHRPTWDIANSIPPSSEPATKSSYETDRLQFSVRVPAKAKAGAKKCIDLVLAATDGTKTESREYAKCYTVAGLKKSKKHPHA
jgi:hypothetical protein